ncbi:MAG: hypothetical protein ACRDRY_00105 [Pseudonocardiaceae bacterium]
MSDIEREEDLRGNPIGLPLTFATVLISEVPDLHDGVITLLHNAQLREH